MANLGTGSCIYVKDSLADLQELSKLSKDSLEKTEYRIAYLKGKIAQIKRKERRKVFEINELIAEYQFLLDKGEIAYNEEGVDLDYENFYSFLKKHPKRSGGSASPEDVKVLITQNELKDLLYRGPIEKIIEYDRLIRRIKLEANIITSQLRKLEKHRDDYKENIDKNSEKFRENANLTEKIQGLLHNILELKNLVLIVPESTSTDSSKKFLENNFIKYCTYYSSLKKTIEEDIVSLEEQYGDKEWGIGNQGDAHSEFVRMYGKVRVESIKEILYCKPGGSLPKKYKDVLGERARVLDVLKEIIIRLNFIVENNKEELRRIIGVAGTGNHRLDNLINESTKITKYLEDIGKIDHIDLEDVVSANKEKYEEDKQLHRQLIDNATNFMKGTEENLDRRFTKAFRTMLLRFGFPVKSLTNGMDGYKNSLRKKVRERYGGNIPFCDEVVYTDENGKVHFILKEDFDESAGKPKSEVKISEALDQTGL